MPALGTSAALHVPLGRTQVTVSRIGFGTAPLGALLAPVEPSGLDAFERESVRHLMQGEADPAWGDVRGALRAAGETGLCYDLPTLPTSFRRRHDGERENR
jgi:hypothetical protein